MTEKSLSVLVEEAKARVAAMSPAERDAMWQAQRESWVRGEMAMGETATLMPPMTTNMVKPLDLSMLLRSAFLTGRGLKEGDKLSDADHAAWTGYDPSPLRVFQRIEAALQSRAADPWQPVAPEGWFLYSAANEHTRIIYNGDKHEPLPHAEGPWRVAFQRLPHGGRLTDARGRTFREAWDNACAAVASETA
ncbi:hypothetical protein NKI96_10755 [Mesorhizobium sp. M0292]|uniref:hypothetical protein n=1 Tax=Mesorhizobium sp. M0292 TaxID=2956929 RepID=UPI00333CB239